MYDNQISMRFEFQDSQTSTVSVWVIRLQIFLIDTKAKFNLVRILPTLKAARVWFSGFKWNFKPYVLLSSSSSSSCFFFFLLCCYKISILHTKHEAIFDASTPSMFIRAFVLNIPLLWFLIFGFYLDATNVSSIHRHMHLSVCICVK